MFEQSKQGAVDVIFASEPLHLEQVEHLRALLHGYLDEGQPHIVLDLHGVPLIDSSGLELLLDTHEQCQHRGGALKLSSVNHLCAEILKVSGVGPMFETYPDTGAAVGSFGR